MAVLGSGPAGLSAALSLAEAGAEVVVYDAAARVGGLLRTEDLDGARVDVAVQLVSSTHTALFHLARRAGAADVLARSPGRDALWRKGRAHGITYGSVSSMVTSGALPTTLKLRLGAKYLPFLTTRARTLDANDPAATGGIAFDGESIGAWGRRELGDDFVELLAYPLLAAYYGATPEETSAAAYHALARVGMDVQVCGARGGFGTLAQKLAAAIEARRGRFVLERRVTGLKVGDDDVVIEGERFDAAVLAVPAHTAAGLLQDSGARSGAGILEWLRQVQQRTTLTVAYRLDRAVPADWFGLSFPRATEPGRRAAVLCVQGRKLPGLVPSGDAVVVIPAPAATPALLDLDDDSVAGMLLEAVASAVRGIPGRVTQARTCRHDAGYTLFAPGHLKRIRAFDADALPPRLALAGAWLVAPSVEGAVRSGARAARRILDTVGQRRAER